MVKRSILLTAVEEYHKAGAAAKFTLVCIQVPQNWKYFNGITEKNAPYSIGPQTAAYYEAILEMISSGLASKGKPLIYVRPGLAETVHYLYKNASSYVWGAWECDKRYKDDKTNVKSTLFFTLLAKEAPPLPSAYVRFKQILRSITAYFWGN